MNRFYLIIPLVLLSLFGCVYWQHSQQRATELMARTAAASTAKKTAQAEQVVAEGKAREAAAQRTAARLTEEQTKQTTERAQWAAETARIATDTDAYLAQSAQLRSDLAKIEGLVRAAREATAVSSAQALELAREVELARIAKRNAELELQRTTAILARRAAQSGLVRE